ncbi:MAG: hypothetical protein MZW92_33545 [Comamonadaceae bacterium]|nr:hypothetical protein [Comamonadaceae bacterium]
MPPRPARDDATATTLSLPVDQALALLVLLKQQFAELDKLPPQPAFGPVLNGDRAVRTAGPRSLAVELKYLRGYPPDLLEQVRRLIDAGTLAETVAARHPEPRR